MEQTSNFQRLPPQPFQVPTQLTPTSMDTQRDGVEQIDRESRYALFVAEASVREAALQEQVGFLSEQLAARYFFFLRHCLCSMNL